MADLAALAEVDRLGNGLGIEGAELDFLARYDASDLRRLRHGILSSLAAPHRAAFRRMAAAVKVLPAPVVASIATTALGPFVCSQVAAELDPADARQLVGRLDVPFLADLCRTLDAHAGASVIQAIPAERAVAVGAELYRRRDIDTLARFVDVVAEDTIARMLAVVADDGFLLDLAVAAEDRERLDAIVAALPDDRLLGLVEAAGRSGRLASAVVLLGELGPEQAGRVIRTVIGSGDELLALLVAEVDRLGGWDELLPVLARLEPGVIAAVAASPVLARPEGFRVVAEGVVAASLAHEFVALVAAMPAERQEALAAALAVDAPEIARQLLDLVGVVDGAEDLAATRTLRSALRA